MNPNSNQNQNQILKIIVAGGDGFIGWPLALRLSNLGH
jgi:nucleoside-diphosphate-sugar epimerase